MKKSYFHLFANGQESASFIVSKEDFRGAFNRVGICAHCCDVFVLAFSIEETHPHFLIYGEKEECTRFMRLYETLTMRYIAITRGSKGDFNMKMALYEVDSEEYLMNVAAYVIVQPTKDGKKVMPYEYLWGTASLYFRRNLKILPWLFDEDGNRLAEKELSMMSVRERYLVLKSRKELPGNWKLCNGLLLPTNYVNIGMYEAIFKTHNCFRTFLSSGKRRDEEIVMRMSRAQSPMLEDVEARKVCADTSQSIFGHASISKLSVQERISLAQVLRRDFGLAVRQLSEILHIPLPELRRFVK